MKQIAINLIFLITGIGMVAVVIFFEIDNTAGWLLATLGFFLVFLSMIYKTKKAGRNLFDFFTGFF